MARTTGQADLNDLLSSGRVRAGTRLEIRRRSASPVSGTITARGGIRVGGTTYDTPSAAARAALDLRSADGWLRWRLPEPDGRSLAQLRDLPTTSASGSVPHLNLGNLGGQPFQTVLADPPWRFLNRTGKVAPEHKRLSRYDTMTTHEIAEIPVSDVAASRAHCYLWVPNALITEGLSVLRSWGFTYKAMIVWHKVRKDGGSDGRGVGFYFRNVTEPILFGVRGSMRTLAPGRRQVNLLATRKREHSRKPDELYDIIEACSPGPYLEMFARHSRAGWTAWGAEADAATDPRGKPYKGYGG